MKKYSKIYDYIINGRLDIEQIMREYTGYIYTIIQNKSDNFTKEDIEEIISDTFTCLWNNQEKLDINKDLSPYISGITKNLIMKKYRTLKKHEDIEDFDEKLVVSEGLELFYENQEKYKIIENQLSQMKQEDKEIFMMYYYENRKIREISGALNITESKIKSKLSRLRKKFNKLLGE